MLHTLYYSPQGDINNYFDVYKIHLSKEETSFLSYLLTLFFSCNYFYLLGPFAHCESETKCLVFKRERQSTPYGRVYIPNLPEKGVCYLQTKDYDMAFNFTIKEKECFLYINKIFKFPYEFYETPDK